MDLGGGPTLPIWKDANGFRVCRVAAALAFVVSTALVCTSCQPRESFSQADEPTGEELASVFRGVELVDQDADGTFWRLTAAEGTARESEVTGTLKDVHVEFRKNGPGVRMSAGAAQVDRGDEVRLSEGVELSWDGHDAKVRRAVYLRGEGVIRSEDPVAFTGPWLSVNGSGVELDVEGRVARIRSGVRAVIRGARP